MMNQPDLPPQDQTRLVSWKEIAAFFRVTIRTVQNWEAERGLPVHRIPGSHGRVYADTSELIAWQAQVGTLPPKLESDDEPAEEAPRRSRRWLLAAVVPLILIAVMVWRFWPAKREAVAVRLQGPALIALDREGNQVWRYVFDEDSLTNDDLSKIPVTGPFLDRAAFADIDGDGKKELIFPFRSRARIGQDDALFVFSPDGDPLWHFKLTDQVKSKSTTYSRIYGLNQFRVLSIPGLRGVLASFHNDPSEPSALVLLSLEGKPLRRYWHSGHINVLELFDLNSDGIPEIILGAVANYHETGDIVVLDPRTFGGASLEDDKHQILDQGPPVELARLLLPRTRLGRALAPYNAIQALRHEGGQLRVEVSEVPAYPSHNVGIYYHFNLDLKLADVHAGDTTGTTYRYWYDQGSINFLWDKSELNDLRQIRYLTPLR